MEDDLRIITAHLDDEVATAPFFVETIEIERR